MLTPGDVYRDGRAIEIPRWQKSAHEAGRDWKRCSMQRRTSSPDFTRIVRATRAFIATPGRAASPFYTVKHSNSKRDGSLSQNQPQRFHLNLTRQCPAACGTRSLLPQKIVLRGRSLFVCLVRLFLGLKFGSKHIERISVSILRIKFFANPGHNSCRRAFYWDAKSVSSSRRYENNSRVSLYFARDVIG